MNGICGSSSMHKNDAPATVASSRPQLDVSLVTLVSFSLALTGILLLVRARLVGTLAPQSFEAPFAAIEKTVAAGYHDLAFVALAVLPFLLLVLLAGERAGLQRALRASYAAWCLLVLLAAFLNISIIKYLGKPFTYQWLYYSDFLGSMEAQQAILANLKLDFVVALATALALFLVLLWIARRLTLLAMASGYRNWAAVLAVLLVAGCLAYGRAEADEQRFKYSRVVNPVVAFINSLALDEFPVLYTMPTTVPPDDFAPPAAVAAPARPAAEVRNVVLFVLESVPAALVGLYGSPFATTPELDARRDQALVFRNAYAHWPTTNASLVSLLTGTYPWVAAKTITARYPDIPLAALSSELKRRGYRTAFFNSADLRFQNAAGFLAHRDLDVIEDYRTIPCDIPVKQHTSRETFSSIGWVNLDGIDDVCTADAFVDWIAADPERPFFGVLWTTMTHYPYFAPQDEVDFATDDDELYRYLNALRHGDRALGRVLAGLERLGVADDTLVVVLGDHGEAHGQHGERGHGSQLYQENIHIPLVLINPRLFRGETSDAIGGLVDIAPTVIDILGLAPAATWQGRSLLAAVRPPRTYFFSPLAELLFGYREGDLKYIYNASRDSLEIYDLARDPNERQSIDHDPQRRDAILERLAAWVQYQDRFIRSLAEPHVSAR